MKKLLMLFGCFLMLNACATAPVQEPVKMQVSINAKFDKVWNAAVKILTVQKYSFKTIDKPSGVLQTEEQVYEGSDVRNRMDSYAKMPFVLFSVWTKMTTSYDILMLAESNGTTTILISANVSGYDMHGKEWHKGTTNGTLENMLLSSIKKELGITD